MLKQLVKTISILLAFFSAILILAVSWASQYVDSPSFRKDLTSGLSMVVGREVTLLGELDVTVYPWFGLRAHGLSVANEPGFGENPYVSCREVSLGVKVLPLLARKLIVSEIVVDGMETLFVRNADSEVNWDFYERDSNADQLPVFSYFRRIFIEGVTVKNAMITFDDGKQNESMRLHGLSAKVGAFTPGEAAGFNILGVFDRGRSDLSIEAGLSGIVNTDIFSSGLMFSDTAMEVLVKGGGLPENETLRMVSDLEYEGAEGVLRFSNMHFRFLDMNAGGQLELNDAFGEWRLTGRFDTEVFSPSVVLKRLAPRKSYGKAKALQRAKASFSLQATADGVKADALHLLLDETSLTGSLQVSGYDFPHVDFNLSGTRFNLDRYLPLFETDDSPFVWKDFALPFWGKMEASGIFSIQEFQAFDTDFGNVKAQFSARQGHITASAKGGGYGGLINASLDMNIDLGNDFPGLKAALQTKISSAKLSALPISAQGLEEIDGPVNLETTLLIDQPSCPPQARSIDTLRNMTFKAIVESPSTAVRLKGEKSRLKLDKARLELQAAGEKETLQGYRFVVNALGKLGKRSSPHSATISWKGPLEISESFDAISSPGGQWRLKSVGWWLPGLDERLSAKGRASFSPGFKGVRLDDVEIKALDATLAGNAVARNVLIDGRSVSGSLSLYGFNPESVIEKFGVEVHEMEDETVFDFLTAHADYVYEGDVLSLSGLKAQIDDTAITGAIETNIQNPPGFTVALKFGRVDLDRYLTPDTDVDLEKLRAGIDEDAPPVKMPLEFLTWLTVKGSLQIDEFILQDLLIQNLAGTVDTGEGTLTVSQISGDFYGGTLGGSLNGQVQEKELEAGADLHLRDFSAGPMLSDIAGREYVVGNTNMKINLSGRGATDDAIVASLDGNIDLGIGKGSYKFTNWDRKLTLEQKKEGVPDPSKQRTSFSKVFSRWAVREGYFDMKEFELESPLMAGGGHGGFNPSEEHIDLSFKADFVAVPSVTVRIVGHIQDPEIKVPKDKIVRDTLQNIINIPQKSLRFFRDLFF